MLEMIRPLNSMTVFSLVIKEHLTHKMKARLSPNCNSFHSTIHDHRLILTYSFTSVELEVGLNKTGALFFCFLQSIQLLSSVKLILTSY